MKHIKRLFAWLSVYSLAIGLFVAPAFAVPALPGGGDLNPSIGFDRWLVNGLQNSNYDTTVQYINRILSQNDSGCPNSSNGCHIWETDFGTAGIQLLANSWDAHCLNCGETLSHYKGKQQLEDSDLSDLYDDHVGTLPMTGIDSAGGFLWKPTSSDLVKAVAHVCYDPGYLAEVSEFPATISNYSSISTVGLGSDGLSLVSVPPSGRDYIGREYANASYVMTFRFPIGGSYSVISESSAFSGTYTRLNGYPSRSFTSTYNNALWKRGDSTSSNDGYAKNAIHISAGDIRGLFGSRSLETGDSNIDYKGVVTVSASVSFPSFSVIPDSTLGGDYTDNSRPASITGDYGIINQGGDLSVVHDHSIVNETDNSVYNPVTNETLSFDGWKYDYSTRTYTLTGGNNETTTVTYGDENITINEGGTTYVVYYTIPQPEPPAHQHNYVGTVTTQPTCTIKGVKTYICSECSNSYTEAVPALGHDWQVKTSVQSEYNEQGELTTQGYTIFKCSRCGEEKRSEDGIPPPSGGGDDTGLTIPDENGLQLLRDTLVNFFQTLPAMFGELTDFLSSTFSYIPQDIMYLITFAVGISVLMAFFKFFWR